MTSPVSKPVTASATKSLSRALLLLTALAPLPSQAGPLLVLEVGKSATVCEGENCTWPSYNLACEFSWEGRVIITKILHPLPMGPVQIVEEKIIRMKQADLPDFTYALDRSAALIEATWTGAGGKMTKGPGRKYRSPRGYNFGTSDDYQINTFNGRGMVPLAHFTTEQSLILAAPQANKVIEIADHYCKWDEAFTPEKPTVRK